MNPSQVRLTQTVQKGGCAAKVAATELRKILGNVRFPKADDSLMVDGSLFDDAAIIRVSAELALVQTLDFFTPIVDTPSLFGKIACANALSDVYAMGGVPKTALAILAFPLATLPSEIATEVLQGACDVLSEAHVPLVGGHSIDDDTLKFGLSVTGYVHPEKVWSNSQAHSGDLLILTKGLGTGTITAALKRSEISESEMSEALSSMCQINQILDLLGSKEATGIHAATDITGFGLLGHSLQMAIASQKSFAFDFKNLPVLDLALSCLEKKFLTKAHRTNMEYVERETTWGNLNETQRQLLVDPQTSGGLLLSVDPSQAAAILNQLRPRFPRAAVVGQVQEKQISSVNLR